jgi:hypothetical protein
MLRLYSRTWLVHHHAGNTVLSARAGLDVLNQVGQYTYDAHRLYSTHMDYLMSFFRSGNKFPSRVFGRVTQSINDPKGSSIDTFAYYHYKPTGHAPTAIAAPWSLTEATSDDLKLLQALYEETNGGLALHATDLTPEASDLNELAEEFRRMGFQRERHLLSLRNGGHLVAVVMANVTDAGLNLSDLTSAMTIWVLDPDQLQTHVFERTVAAVAELYGNRNLPILLYPAGCADTLGIHPEKLYNLWILNTQYSDHYFRHLKRLIRFVDA